MKRIAIIAIGLALTAVVAGGVWMFSSKTAAADSEFNREIVTIEQGSVVSSVNGTGTLDVARDATLSFEINGTIDEVLVERGQQVQEGDALARLETDDLELNLAEAENNLADVMHGARAEDIVSAEAALHKAEANYADVADGAGDEDVAAAEASLRNARANYEGLLAGKTEDEITAAAAEVRAAQVNLEEAQRAYDKIAYADNIGESTQAAELERKTIAYQTALSNYNLAVEGASDEKLEASAALVDKAQADLDKLQNSPTESELAQAEAQVDEARAALEKLLNEPTEEAARQAELEVQRAELALEQAVLTAPIDGVVTEVNVAVGERVEVQAVVAMVDLTSLYVKVPVDEIDLPAVKIGQSAIVTLDAMPDRALDGLVSAIAPAPINSADSVTSYEVTVDLPDIDEVERTVAVGMTANVAIETERRDGVVVVPDYALQVDGETGVTYVDKVGTGGQALRTEVRLGTRSGGNIEVLSGLKAGDRVLVPVAEDDAKEGEDGVFGGMPSPREGGPTGGLAH